MFLHPPRQVVTAPGKDICSCFRIFPDNFPDFDHMIPLRHQHIPGTDLIFGLKMPRTFPALVIQGHTAEKFHRKNIEQPLR